MCVLQVEVKRAVPKSESGVTGGADNEDDDGEGTPTGAAPPSARGALGKAAAPTAAASPAPARVSVTKVVVPAWGQTKSAILEKYKQEAASASASAPTPGALLHVLCGKLCVP